MSKENQDKTQISASPPPRVPASEAKRLRFALIGTGGIAQTYAQAFQESNCCDLVAVADINKESADAFSEPFNAKIICGL